MFDDFELGDLQDFGFGDKTSTTTTTTKSEGADWGIVAVLAIVVGALAYAYSKTPATEKAK